MFAALKMSSAMVRGPVADGSKSHNIKSNGISKLSLNSFIEQLSITPQPSYHPLTQLLFSLFVANRLTFF